jgi:Glycosyltransferase family 10 (fucosyltransferase) C-term
MIRIKLVSKGLEAPPKEVYPEIPWKDCLFLSDPNERNYDWLVVYDEFPRTSAGSIINGAEPLACPREQTILVTVEPPTIKTYSSFYTKQFGYVLTTHSPDFLPHRNHRTGRGCLYWIYGKPLDEVLSSGEPVKTKMLSTVSSAKQQRHTQHNNRFALVSYLSKHLPELDWYGYGVIHLEHKYEALDPYKYHVAIENYLYPNHWTEKLADSFLGLCLPFYAGDPNVAEIFPEESFIPIPINDHERACAIIREAMDNGEYEKRLPAIREARRLIIEKYNFYQQVSDVIHEHMAQNTAPSVSTGKPFILKGRHRLRRNPINALIACEEHIRFGLKAMRTDNNWQ